MSTADITSEVVIVGCGLRFSLPQQAGTCKYVYVQTLIVEEKLAVTLSLMRRVPVTVSVDVTRSDDGMLKVQG